MNKKERRFAINEVLKAAESQKCEQLHHALKDRHSHDAVCPAEYRLHRQIHIVREYFAECLPPPAKGE